MKQFYMEGEKLTGCGVIEVNFSTPTGLQVWYLESCVYLLKILIYICNVFVLGWINIDKTNNLENLEIIKRIVKREFYFFILN